MKCKSCAGNYKTKELICPYCGHVNLLGKLWLAEKSEAEREYEKAREDYKKRVSPYVINRLLSRVLLICGIVLALFVLGLTVVDKGAQAYKAVCRKTNAKEYETMMKQYYENRELGRLYEYMSEKDLFGEEQYRCSQAALLGYDFERFQGYKLRFLELPEEKKQEDTYYLKYSITRGLEVYTLDVGNYSEPIPENEALYEELRREVMAYLVGTLGLTEEEVLPLTKESVILSSDAEPLVKLAKERRAWNE
ncbi:MAG: hypothetical protein IJZ55_04390 [Lachnospiraceae bacterium]|nr:hypothetical protein [Lachnospiraceae bacterium]